MNPFLKVGNSFKYALAGAATGFKTQLNFRIQVLAAIAAVCLGFTLKLNTNEWLWVALSIALVLSAEIFNSALELLVDMVSPGYDLNASKVKDMAAAGVTIISAFAFITGIMVFVPKLWLVYQILQN